jgi:hypothetical protein
VSPGVVGDVVLRATARWMAEMPAIGCVVADVSVAAGEWWVIGFWARSGSGSGASEVSVGVKLTTGGVVVGVIAR